jgi:hypothetical protein
MHRDISGWRIQPKQEAPARSLHARGSRQSAERASARPQLDLAVKPLTMGDVPKRRIGLVRKRPLY